MTTFEQTVHQISIADPTALEAQVDAAIADMRGEIALIKYEVATSAPFSARALELAKQTFEQTSRVAELAHEIARKQRIHASLLHDLEEHLRKTGPPTELHDDTKALLAIRASFEMERDMEVFNGNAPTGREHANLPGWSALANRIEALYRLPSGEGCAWLHPARHRGLVNFIATGDPQIDGGWRVQVPLLFRDSLAFGLELQRENAQREADGK